MDAMRIDKWLWAARFFKTRSLAQEEVGLGRVLIAGHRAKPSRDVRVGDRLEIRRGDEVFVVYVEALSNQRGPAEAAKERRQIAFEPASTIRHGRPTKREGRELRRLREGF